jgi:hypothetical protein
MTEARQKVMARIGKDGCYFLSIIRAAERITGQRIDAVKVYLNAIDRKWMEADCYVVDPAALLESLTDKPWKVRHDSVTHRPAGNEIMIMRYELKSTGITYSHFVLCDHTGQVEYDPYGASSTVRDGKPVSSRIFSHVQ